MEVDIQNILSLLTFDESLLKSTASDGSVAVGGFRPSSSCINIILMEKLCAS